jgi:hypothetical protein
LGQVTALVNNNGVYATCSSTAGAGYGCTSGNNTGTADGVFGTSTTGIGVEGTSTSTSSSGYGVKGVSQTNVGVYGESVNVPGVGGSWGVYGRAHNNYSGGVLGYDDAQGYGVYGQIRDSGSPGAGYAIYGDNDSSSGYAGYFQGRVYATSSAGSVYGIYSKTTGSSSYAGYFDATQGTTSVGIYTTASGDALEAYATNGNYSAVYGQNVTGGYGVRGVISPAGAGEAIYGDNNSGSGYAGYFHGNVYATGSIQQNSDARLKKNIQPLTGGLDQLLKLRGVTFEWNDVKEHPSQIGTQRGFVAQDVEKVFPGWVGEDRDGFKTLSLQQLEALEVEGIRTLKKENDELGKRIESLESGRHPIAAGLNLNGIGFGVGGLAIAGAILASRRRRPEAA